MTKAYRKPTKFANIGDCYYDDFGLHSTDNVRNTNITENLQKKSMSIYVTH